MSEWSAEGSDDAQPMAEKRAYIHKELRNDLGVVDVRDENYTRLPIAVLYGNDTHESELVGLRGSIDCYDLSNPGLPTKLTIPAEFTGFCIIPALWTIRIWRSSSRE